MCRRKRLLTLALIILALSPAACQKSPSTSTSPTSSGLSASFNPASAGPDTVVSFVITITANSKEIRSFGADAAFDPKMFSFQGVVRGSLTGSWELFDASENSPGAVRLAGAVGGGTSVAANSSGTLFEVRFKVTGGSFGNGQQSQVCLSQFTDDLTQFSTGNACASFTLKK